MKAHGCPFRDGEKVTALIKSNPIEGEICYEDKRIYILHNCVTHAHGNTPIDRKGYKYGWMVVREGNNDYNTWSKGLKWNTVSNVKPLDSKGIYIEIEEEESEVDIPFKCKKKRKLNI